MLVRNYVALLLQLIIWSIFSIAKWLSGNDYLASKVILFIVFLFLAFAIARKLVKSNRITILLTMISLFAYSIIQTMLYFIEDII